ncbi:hypothetical protein C8R43DRAFT_529824 [Mycena crocata]|nr:hypothetical protein C8R43DRAFT_529824 [Mycena crocata]
MADLNEPFVDAEFTSETIIDEPHAGSQYAGAFFQNASKLTVQGGIFTSNTHIHESTSLPADFRTIPLGDINLEKEILGVLWRRGSGCRRIYSARIDGKKSKMTVAMYQGDNAKDEWKEAIRKISGLRHPNVIQIYGAAKSCGMYTTIFHDDLIPMFNYFELYHKGSHFSTAWFWAFCHAEWNAAHTYLGSVCQRDFYSSDCAFWIRRSSFRLCVDLVWDTDMERTFMDPGAFNDHLANGSMSLDCPNPESTVVTSLTLEEHHSICYSHMFRGLELIIPEAAKLRSVISHTAGSELQRVVEVAAVPEVGIDAVPGWYVQGEEEITSEMTASGWIRYSACNVVGRRVDKLLRIKPADAVFWLSQAHYIFSLLKVTPNFEDYMFVTSVIFVIQTPPTPQSPPEGFLFLCPTEHLHVVGSNSFQWPDIPAYWSLERSGVERLGTEDAKSLGFPIIERKIHLIGKSWDASVYAGLRQFHAAKGFDPDSLDVARHFGYPLYKLSADLDASAEHGAFISPSAPLPVLNVIR